MDAEGHNQRLLTHGFEDNGADYVRWLPIPINHELASPSIPEY